MHAAAKRLVRRRRRSVCVDDAGACVVRRFGRTAYRRRSMLRLSYGHSGAVRRGRASIAVAQSFQRSCRDRSQSRCVVPSDSRCRRRRFAAPGQRRRDGVGVRARRPVRRRDLACQPEVRRTERPQGLSLCRPVAERAVGRARMHAARDVARHRAQAGRSGRACGDHRRRDSFGRRPGRAGTGACRGEAISAARRRAGQPGRGVARAGRAFRRAGVHRQGGWRRMGVAIECADERGARLGACARARFLACGRTRRRGGCRRGRRARLPGERCRDTRDPARARHGEIGAQVHVGGARRGAQQAGACVARGARRFGRPALHGRVSARGDGARRRARRSSRRDRGARRRPCRGDERRGDARHERQGRREACRRRTRGGGGNAGAMAAGGRRRSRRRAARGHRRRQSVAARRRRAARIFRRGAEGARAASADRHRVRGSCDVA